jgi:indolepyruvate ferredoxin oxidoreductase alpha subunit
MKGYHLLMGNGAIARGIIESGCQVATAYPGTPSTEILQEVARFKNELGLPIYVEWSVNEKVAFDVALAASMAGKRSATSMKQVGLNVASDSMLSCAYTGVVGGMVVIPCDDPGPHSSQTEQDSRLFAIFAKVPVLDPSTPREAKQMIKYAFDLSIRFQIPVMVRPTIRICHARQGIEFEEPYINFGRARFEKDPPRWAATPPYRYKLHKQLNEKLATIKWEFNRSPLNYTLNSDLKSGIGIIGSGAVFSVVRDMLDELGIKIPILKIGTPFPLPDEVVRDFVSRYPYILVLEETNAAIELQLPERANVLGRLNGVVQSEGELTPDAVYNVLCKVQERIGRPVFDLRSSVLVPDLKPSVRPPTLCPGCPHRAVFYAMRRALPNAVYPSDIGCYTLGLNMKAVDTVIDMGAAITISDGLYKAYAQGGQKAPPIVATIGDSTMYHAGIPALLNARVTDARFVLIILDNESVAMTGWQPTPGTGIQVDGRKVPKVPLRRVVEGCGVEFIEEIDPYDFEGLKSLIKRAHEYTQRPDGGIAVIIAHHPCPLIYPDHRKRWYKRVEISQDCNGCRYCIIAFECPALYMEEGEKRARIDRKLCIDCGICIYACHHGAIVEVE